MSDHRAAGRASVVGRLSRRQVAVLAVLVTVLATAGTTWFTGASFTATTFGQVVVGAADDYRPPTVSVTSPGTTVSGTVQVQATASDTASGVAQVRIEHAAAGSSAWTTLCTDTTAPYSCSWNTLLVADGGHQLRATATDVAGFTATSAVVTTTVANPATVVLATIPDAVRGNVALSATVIGAGSRPVSSAFQHRVDGATSWTTISGCATVAGTTPTCPWNTGSLADLHDIRVVSTVGTGTAALVVSDEQLDVVVDNVAPTVTISAPSPMSGTVQVTATAADEDSGINRVELSYKLAAASAYTPLCTVSAEPYRCALNTTNLQNQQNYDLRAIAVDEAGNTSTPAVVRRQVNNGINSITITSPLTGDLVGGTHTLTTDYSSVTGTLLTSVLIEARLGNGAWVTVCTDSSAPFTCDWTTTSLATGTWDLRATLRGALNATVATSPVVSVIIDNTPLKAFDLQAANGGVANIPDTGDTFTFTYQGAVDLTTLKSGWDGSPTSLTATFADRAVNPSGTQDRVSFSVPLGTVTFVQNYVKKNKTAALAATMSAATTTAGGTTYTVVTVTLNGTSGNLRSSTTAGAMRWTPLATVRNLAGAACSTTPATESGASDRDL